MSKDLHIAGLTFKAPPEGLGPDAFLELQSEWVETLTKIKPHGHTSILQDLYITVLNFELLIQYKLEIEKYAQRELKLNSYDQNYTSQQPTFITISRNSPIENSDKIAYYQPTDADQYPYISFDIDVPATSESVYAKGVFNKYDEFDDDFDLSMKYHLFYGPLEVIHRGSMLEVNINGVNVLSNSASKSFQVEDLNVRSTLEHGKDTKELQNKIERRGHIETGSVNKFIPGKWLFEIEKLHELSVVAMDFTHAHFSEVRKNIAERKATIELEEKLKDTLHTIDNLGAYGF